MTENETIERCDLLINSLSVDNGVTNAFCDRSKGYVTFEKMREFTKSCKKALEEVQQYRQIGTVEECREAVEKQTANKPDYEGDEYSDGQLVYDTWICPSCGKHYEVDCDRYDYCKNCGQHIDWSDEV